MPADATPPPGNAPDTAAERAGWRVLPFAEGDAADLLDRGVAMLDALADDPTPTLAWYRARTPAIVLGRGQQLAPDAAPTLPVVSRFSGGGAVLLDRSLLSLDVLLPDDHPLLTGDLAAVFDRVGDAWAAALRDLGVAGLEVHRGPGTARRRGDERERLLAAVCYATAGRGEVLHAGRKLVGLAQRRRRPGALVQCGLLRRWAPGPLLAALGAAPDDPEILTSAVGLDDLLDVPPDDAAVMAAVERHLLAAGA
jgi:lipoate---protein ligase